MQIELRKPVTFQGKSVDRLTLREPTIGDVLASIKHIADGVSLANIDKFTMELVAKASDLDMATIQGLDIRTIRKAFRFIETFPLTPTEITSDDVYADDHLIPLDSPISFNKTTVTELVINSPTGAQVLAADAELNAGSNAETITKRSFKLLCAVTGYERPVMEKLPITKFREAEKVLGFFMEDFQQTTER